MMDSIHTLKAHFEMKPILKHTKHATKQLTSDTDIIFDQRPKHSFYSAGRAGDSRRGELRSLLGCFLHLDG